MLAACLQSKASFPAFSPLGVRPPFTPFPFFRLYFISRFYERNVRTFLFRRGVKTGKCARRKFRSSNDDMVSPEHNCSVELNFGPEAHPEVHVYWSLSKLFIMQIFLSAQSVTKKSPLFCSPFCKLEMFPVEHIRSEDNESLFITNVANDGLRQRSLFIFAQMIFFGLLSFFSFFVSFRFHFFAFIHLSMRWNIYSKQ